MPMQFHNNGIYEFLDRSRSRQVLAEAIREAYADLFSVNTKANDLSADDVKNKLRTLYTGKKTDLVVGNIAKTFNALCEYADFSKPLQSKAIPTPEPEKPQKSEAKLEKVSAESIRSVEGAIRLESLQYHINIVLPESRDQAVYDAIFKSLREHLGARHG